MSAQETQAKNPFIGVGLYTLADAARILRLHPSKIRRWAKGYSFVNGDALRHSEPMFRRESAELVEHDLLSFADVIEMKLISGFIEQGIKLPAIRKVAEYVAVKLGESHPLARLRFHTDGKLIVGEWLHGKDQPEAPATVKQFFEELPSGQMVLPELVEPFFKKLDYADDMTVRYWPLGKDRAIVLDPLRNFGHAIVEKSGVPTDALYAMAAGKSTRAEVAWWYDVDPADVDAALEYEQKLRTPIPGSTIAKAA